VGTVAIEFSSKFKTKHKVHIVGMFVSAAHRGRGIGKALLHAVLEYARSHAFVRLVTLSVTEGNESAPTLYEACGFKQFCGEPMVILTPPGYKAKVLMWRALDEAA